MARFVMVQFDDNDEADNFVKSVGENVVAGNPEVKAVWAMPTMLCECHPPWLLPNRKDKYQSYCDPVRSKTYGWLVCPKCAKPHPYQVQHPKNLLDGDKPTSERIWYLGFRADQLPPSQRK